MQRYLTQIGQTHALVYVTDYRQLSAALQAVEADRKERVQWLPSIQILDGLRPEHESLRRYYLNTERGLEQFRLAHALAHQDTLRQALKLSERGH